MLSDTHGSYPAWSKALKLFGSDATVILHAGDVLYHGPRNAIPGGYTPADLMNAINNCEVKIIIARGNCDAPVDEMVLAPKIQNYVSIIWHGKKIFMMHGDNYPLFKQASLDNKVDLAISGHTHIPSISKCGNVTFLNPGSTTIPKGPSPQCTAAVVTDEDIRVMTLDGEELYREAW